MPVWQVVCNFIARVSTLPKSFGNFIALGMPVWQEFGNFIARVSTLPKSFGNFIALIYVPVNRQPHDYGQEAALPSYAVCL